MSRRVAEESVIKLTAPRPAWYQVPGWGHSTVGAQGLCVGAYLILSQCLLGQVVFPLHLDLHGLGDVRYQEVEDPADGEHHMLGAGDSTSSGRGHPTQWQSKCPEWPSWAQVWVN